MLHSPPPSLRSSIHLALVLSLLGLHCGEPGEQRRPDAALSASTPTPVSVPSDPTPVVEPADPATAALLNQLQGKWKVRSSSGRADGGHAFFPLIGETVTIEGDRLSYPASGMDGNGTRFTYSVTKRITLLPWSVPQAIDLDPAPEGKAWSRVGIVVVEGNTLKLAVQFPQYARPTSMEVMENGPEVVVLERLPAR